MLSLYLLFMECLSCSCRTGFLSGVIPFHPGGGRKAFVAVELRLEVFILPFLGLKGCEVGTTAHFYLRGAFADTPMQRVIVCAWATFPPCVKQVWKHGRPHVGRHREDCLFAGKGRPRADAQQDTAISRRDSSLISAICLSMRTCVSEKTEHECRFLLGDTLSPLPGLWDPPVGRECAVC